MNIDAKIINLRHAQEVTQENLANRANLTKRSGTDLTDRYHT